MAREVSMCAVPTVQHRGCFEAHLHADDFDRLVPAAKGSTDGARGNAVDRVELLALGDTLRFPDRLLGKASDTNPVSRKQRSATRCHRRHTTPLRVEAASIGYESRRGCLPGSPVSHLAKSDGVYSLVDSSDAALAVQVGKHGPPAAPVRVVSRVVR